MKYLCDQPFSGLKVNDQLVACATRFSAVRLKNHVWSHHRTLKAKVQCNFSSAYSPDHINDSDW